MLNSTTLLAPGSSRMGSPIDAPSSTEAHTYLNAGSLPENGNCRFNDTTQRSVTAAQTPNLLVIADPAEQDTEGNTRLCLAAQAGNLVEAQQLISRGADVHHINLDGDNALTLAAAGGHLTFIKWLDGHCPQPVNHENYFGETALTLAARHGHQSLVQWLVSRDASVTHLNDQLKDALAEAVANGHLTLAQWLSSHGADLRRVYPDGNNLFLHAVCAGHQSVVQWLENSGVNSRQINESGNDALALAARHGHHQLLAWLLRKDAAGVHQIYRNGDNLLLIAARRGHCQTVKLLVQHDVDIGLVNYAGSSILTLAAASSESLALWLCSVACDIHTTDLSGNNAFTLAARSGFFQLMQTLEQRGINIHQVNRQNDNAFTLVARWGNLPWCQWLAGKGINIHQVNHRHHNAVTLAALAGSLPLLEWLCAKDVDWQQIPMTPMHDSEHPSITYTAYGFNAAILAASAGHFAEAQWLMRRGLSIRQRDYFGRNAIIQAVRSGRLDAIQWFTAQGIIPDSFPAGYGDELKNAGCNAMTLAAHFGHLHILQWLHQNGGSLDPQAGPTGAVHPGRIPLALAVRRGNLPMAQWLCRQGAVKSDLDDTGDSALRVTAIRNGHLRLSQWLVGQSAEGTPDNDTLMLVARGGHHALFRWLIRPERLNDRQANALLRCALRYGHRSLAVWLCLNVCKNINGADYDDHNALMLAAEHGFLWLTQWLSEHTPRINKASMWGCTALMLAAANGHLPVVQWLYLEKNANLHQRAFDRADALLFAVIGGQTDTAIWLIDQGMTLDTDFFTKYSPNVRWTNNSNIAGLLQCLLHQQLPPGFLFTTMLHAARKGDVPALTRCLSARTSVKDRYFNEDCFAEAAGSGSLAVLEHLCPHSGRDVHEGEIACAAAKRGNLHVIQWLWTRSRLSTFELDCCLSAASANDHFHVVKWLRGHGASFGLINNWGFGGFESAVRHGNIPMLEWFCQQSKNTYRIKENCQNALSQAIRGDKPRVAIWLLHRGFRLTKGDIHCTYNRPRWRLLSMIFKMTSKIGRANLFHSLGPELKLWLLVILNLYSYFDFVNSKRPSEAEVNARFARFNGCNDETLEHKCLIALTKVIEQRSGTFEAGQKAIDSLPISFGCKFDLRELFCISPK